MKGRALALLALALLFVMVATAASDDYDSRWDDAARCRNADGTWSGYCMQTKGFRLDVFSGRYEYRPPLPSPSRSRFNQPEFEAWDERTMLPGGGVLHCHVDRLGDLVTRSCW